MYLAAPYIAAAGELVKCSLAATLVVPQRWQSLGGVTFKVSQHINLLEAQALLAYVRWRIRRGVSDSRIIVIIDSGVVKGAIRKFRSSSRLLKYVLRRLNDLCVGFLYLFRSPLGTNLGQC